MSVGLVLPCASTGSNRRWHPVRGCLAIGASDVLALLLDLYIPSSAVTNSVGIYLILL